MQSVDLKKDLLFHNRIGFDKNGSLLLDWTLSGFTFCFNGTKFEIEITSNKFEEFPIFCCYKVDNEPITKIQLNKNNFKIEKEVAQGLHQVTFYRLTEVIVDYTFDVTSVRVQGTVAEKPAEKARKIEFMGDSNWNGYGVLGIANFSEFVPAEEDPTHAVPYLVSQSLNAEGRVTSWSGVGMYCMYDKRLLHRVMEWYPRQLPWRTGCDGKEMHDFTSWVPDIVVICQGTNDEVGEGPVDKVKEKMFEFLRFVREQHKTQPILWVYGLMHCKYNEVYQQLLKEFGDSNIYSIFFDGLRDEEIGNNHHPNVKGQERYAKAIEAKIKEILKW